MIERSRSLQGFLDALATAFAQGDLAPEARQSIDRVERALQHVVAGDATEGRRLPACSSLRPALDRAEQAQSGLSALTGAFEVLEPSLRWATRSGNETASESFADGHANAMIVGPGGLEPRSDIWIGVSLLAPGVRYPDHRHPPEEVYLVLSPGEFRQEDGDWFEPGIGGTFYNRPGILHAMRSGAQPLLAVWCLWVDPASASAA